MYLRRAGLLLLLAASVMTAEPAPPRLLALGDSYTIGEGVTAAERWPAQLAARLRVAGVAVAEPQVIARTGWSTRELLAAVARERPEGPFALVTLQIGVNDQFRGGDVDTYRADVMLALDAAVALAGGSAERVLAVSIPDYGVTPFAAHADRAAIAAAIDRFNAVARAEAGRRGVAWVDVTALSRAAADDRAQVAADGLHPSAAAYARWAEALLPSARTALAR